MVTYIFMISISTLPDELLMLIKEYIPARIMVHLNTYYYALYHSHLRPYIKYYETYVRHMIQYDYSFIFQQILRENVTHWIRNRNYRYKSIAFNNYIYFILYFCNEHKSTNCRELLIQEFEKRDLYKNLHKKNVVKYINGKHTFKCTFT